MDVDVDGLYHAGICEMNTQIDGGTIMYNTWPERDTVPIYVSRKRYGRNIIKVC